MALVNHSVMGWKYRLYPNDGQSVRFQKTFGCCRLYHNIALERTNENYKQTGKIVVPHPAEIKKEEGKEFLLEIDALAFCNEELNIKRAFKNRIQDVKKGSPRNVGQPKFKRKHATVQSYTTNNLVHNGKNSIRFERFDTEQNKYVEDMVHATHILLPKIGRVKLIMHRPLPENCSYSSVTVNYYSSDRYTVSVCVKFDKSVPQRNLNPQNSIGLDYSSPYFFIDNQNKKGDYPRYYREFEDKIARLQRSLSRKVKGSRNYRKARIKLARVTEKVRNKREDWQWKKAKEIATNPNIDYVFIEDISMAEISRRDSEYHLGKSTYDNAWYGFTVKLAQKLEEEGKKLVKIGKWFASSKKCSNCGYVDEKLSLSVRVYECPVCGMKIDRDLNASINIRNEGISTLYKSVGTTESDCSQE